MGELTPFGDTWELAKTSELLVMGIEVLSSHEQFTVIADGTAGFGVLRALSHSDGMDQNGVPRAGRMSTPLLDDVDGTVAEMGQAPH